MSIADTALVRDMQAALRRLRDGKLAAIGSEDDHDDGAHDIVVFLTGRCGWRISPIGQSTGPVVAGTGAGANPRQAVLQNLYESLEHADDLDRRHDLPAPQDVDLIAGLSGIINECARQIAVYGRPFDYQVRAVAETAVRLLERDVEERSG